MLKSLLYFLSAKRSIWTLRTTSNSCADVYIAKIFEDNYAYVMIDRLSNESACIDPGDAKTYLNSPWKSTMKYALCTHKHSDHIGGNVEMKAAIPNLEIVGTDMEPIPSRTMTVTDGSTFDFGKNLRITALHTPCHTKGHICYLIEDKIEKDKTPILFSGDTLFVGGCGRFFEGSAQDMLKNMDRFSMLRPETLVFCAHEYTESNYKFLASIDPDRSAEEYEVVKNLRKSNLPTVPSTISKEKSTNLFMACRELKAQQLLGVTTAVDAMKCLRERKNSFS
jgi:hydroxyacylglutathione hydrolase